MASIKNRINEFWKELNRHSGVFAMKRVTKVRLCDDEKEDIKMSYPPQVHVLLGRHSHFITLTPGGSMTAPPDKP